MLIFTTETQRAQREDYFLENWEVPILQKPSSLREESDQGSETF